MIRLIVCDDHDMVRTALVRVLESTRQFEVVAQAANGVQLHDVLARLPAQGYDVLLLDLTLGVASLSTGIALIGQLLAQQPALRIVVLSMHNDPDVVNAALQSGALGYISKASSIDVLQEGIAHANAGRRFLDPNLVECIMVKRQTPHGLTWDASLTKREREVMALLCGGQSVSAIADSLFLNIKTISTHKVRLMEKLGIKNNAELIRVGMQHDLN
jgi:DNA-binding NarL/FixJ family response regulator